MKKCLLILLLCAVTGHPVFAARPGEHAGGGKTCQTPDGKTECDSGPAWCKTMEGSCSTEMRGRCGKRRGDWYGARQPVGTAEEARKLLRNYFTGQDYTVSEVTEKQWGFKAEILDRNRKIIDRVMIDKRSGRIRSLD